MTTKQNLFVTLILVTINCGLALILDGIGPAMTLVGCTINPIVGFLLPVAFYWPSIKDKPLFSRDKILAILNVLFISVASVLSIV